MSSDISKAIHEGKTALGKTWRDCPHGRDQQALRDAWCTGRLQASRQFRPAQRKALENATGLPLERALSFIAIAVLVLAAIVGIFKVDQFVMTRVAEISHYLDSR